MTYKQVTLTDGERVRTTRTAEEETNLRYAGWRQRVEPKPDPDKASKPKS